MGRQTQGEKIWRKIDIKSEGPDINITALNPKKTCFKIRLKLQQSMNEKLFQAVSESILQRELHVMVPDTPQ